MRRLPAALVTLAAAVNLVVLAVPASAAGRRSFSADPKTVRAGQQLKVFGQGCRARAFVHIYLNGIEIDDDRADRKGQFVDYVEIPGSVDPGVELLTARNHDNRAPSRRTLAPGKTQRSVRLKFERRSLGGGDRAEDVMAVRHADQEPKRQLVHDDPGCAHAGEPHQHDDAPLPRPDPALCLACPLLGGRSGERK
jgi:hypothetical protein